MAACNVSEEPSKTFGIGITQLKCKCYTVIANLVPCDSLSHSTSIMIMQ